MPLDCHCHALTILFPCALRVCPWQLHRHPSCFSSPAPPLRPSLPLSPGAMQNSSEAISAAAVRFRIEDPAAVELSAVAPTPTPVTDKSVQLMPLAVAVPAAAHDDGTSSAMGSPVASAPAASSPSTLAQRRPLAAPDVTQSRPAEATGREKMRMIGQPQQPQQRQRRPLPLLFRLCPVLFRFL